MEIFEAHNIETDESIILSFNEVTDFILENKFINPFTEEEISELEFSKMITTFFQFLRNFRRSKCPLILKNLIFQIILKKSTS